MANDGSGGTGEAGPTGLSKEKTWVIKPMLRDPINFGAMAKLSSRRALDAFPDKRRGAPISFASAHLVCRVLVAKRCELPRVMAGCDDYVSGNSFAIATIGNRSVSG